MFNRHELPDAPMERSQQIANQRLRLLDKQLQAEPFSKWRGRQQRDSAWPSLPAAVPAAESSFESQLCIICLDAIQDTTLIRALTCQHIYHKACFDKWFERDHDVCPLCQRRVLYDKAPEVTV
ncbi:uncharacterized protein B0I36DRAFT_336880 [Microdochium trichocladiopsis]|uniref:RING-type E3 ubiquitin transferase n=1 Tax=Microdochium trichocladiopsis TaxID=1682393 RepID=A0A9P8XW01_9PEZI|nr:uncharacterized protein B0I36DRAFT_336880 [Microdochium trichocladiopsis]KAH7016145.1 hypothetical protein B0I36DRAFT_336880 [Microdochium trichocladiopsis]